MPKVGGRPKEVLSKKRGGARMGEREAGKPTTK